MKAFQIPWSWDLDIERCLENFVPVVIWISFYNFICVAYVRRGLAGALGSTSTL